MFRRISLALLVVGLLPLCIYANEKRQGYCQVQSTGARSVGCTVTVYINGSITLATIYSDNLNTPLSNPFPADSNGLWSFYATNGRYDVRLSGGNPSISPAYTISDVLFLDAGVTFLTSGSVNPAQSGIVRMAQGDCLAWRDSSNTIDNCLTENPSNLLTWQSNVVPVEGTTPLSQGNCVQAGPNGTLTTIVGSCGTATGTVVMTGTPTLNQVMKSSGGTSITNASIVDDGSKVTFPLPIVSGNYNNILTVDGVKYTTLAAALADCPVGPSPGCTIDMRGNSTPPVIGSFDPGSKPVTLLLGPYTYSVHAITLREGLVIKGAGRGLNQTILQSDNTTVDVVTIAAGVVDGVHLEGFRLNCGSGNTTQIGFHIVASANGGGLNYSTFDTISVGFTNAVTCGGGDFLFDGNAAGSPPAVNQFIMFKEVQATRQAGGAPAFRATGLNGQFSFMDVEFDGPGSVDTTTSLTNFQIDDGTQVFRAPYSFFIQNGTFQLSQGANSTAILLKGVTTFTCTTCHFENVNGGVWATIGAHYGGWGITIQGSTFSSNSGIDSGNGFILKSDGNSSIAFDDNTVFGTPDTMFAGTTKYISSKGTVNDSSGVLQPAPAGNRPIGGFDKDGPALKHGRFTTGSIGGGTRINAAVTWTTTFPDANYTATCSVLDATTATTSPGLVFERLNQVQPGSVNITIFNPTGGAITGTLECIAIHD